MDRLQAVDEAGRVRIQVLSKLLVACSNRTGPGVKRFGKPLLAFGEGCFKRDRAVGEAVLKPVLRRCQCAHQAAGAFLQYAVDADMRVADGIAEFSRLAADSLLDEVLRRAEGRRQCQ